MSASADLLLATQANGLTEVLRLLQNGADANVADEVGETPLFEAAAIGNADITAALLLYSADPGHKSSHGMTARDLAASSQITTLLELFQNAPVDDSARDLALASLSGSVKDLMAKRFQQQPQHSATHDEGGAAAAAASFPSESSTDLLLSAVQSNDCIEVERLLSSGAAPNTGDSQGETPLFEASASGNLDIAATLLLYAANPAHRSSHGMNAGDLAADDRMKTLLALFDGRDVKDEAKIVVLDALSQPVRARVSEHLANKSAGSQVTTGKTLLENSGNHSQELQPGAASLSPSESTAQHLERGPEPSQNAAVPDDVDASADVQRSPETLATDLILSAVQANSLQEVQRLVQAGNVDLNVADAMGETPLFEAAASGNLDIAATLLLHTADPAHRSLHGMAASDLAADGS
eukprot:TRINITY_DN8632_c0_g1_i7.p1 TRINITY_DN8632_c0_g1~~TRINITY_DN8632_c0_g1_i7.p1  ORF type:complete len:410 (-),score=90.47 TRINITY_DN8632_c0_g1_i7:672-1901(-)